MVGGILKLSSVESCLEVGKFVAILALAHGMVDVAQDQLARRQRLLQPTELLQVRCQNRVEQRYRNVYDRVATKVISLKK